MSTGEFLWMHLHAYRLLTGWDAVTSKTTPEGMKQASASVHLPSTSIPSSSSSLTEAHECWVRSTGCCGGGGQLELPAIVAAWGQT